MSRSELWAKIELIKKMTVRNCLYGPTTEMGRNPDDSYDPDREEDHRLGMFKYEMSLGHGKRKVRFVVLV